MKPAVVRLEDFRAERDGRKIDDVARRIIELADSSEAEVQHWSRPLWNDGSGLLDFARRRLEGDAGDGWQELADLADASERKPALLKPLWEIGIERIDQPAFWPLAGDMAPYFRGIVEAGRAGVPEARRKLEAVALVEMAHGDREAGIDPNHPVQPGGASL